MNIKDKLTESTVQALSNKNQLTESYNLINFVVKNLIKQKLINDRDIQKAEDLLKAYNAFKNIGRDYIDVPYDVCKMGEDGMKLCYQHLCKMLGTDKLN